MRKVLTIVLLACPGLAAAETVATCKGHIDALPAVIAEQGTWCLDHDVATAIASGNAITIDTNNVTIDCNGYKIGGLGAGPATETTGILANGRLNATVRNCSLRGFRFGVAIIGAGSGGALVERNRLEGNTLVGVFLQGDGSVLRDNQIIDTGPSTGHAWGVVTGGAVDVLANTIAGVTPNPAGSYAGYGISIPSNPGSRVQGNILRDIRDGGSGSVAIMVNTSSAHVVLKDNDLMYTGGNAFSFGIVCENQLTEAMAVGNTMLRYGIPRYGCHDGGGNVTVAFE